MTRLGTRLAFVSLCGLSLYFWTSNTLSKYTVLSDPKTTFLLVILVAAAAIRLASLLIDKLPGSRGRYHEYSSIKTDVSTTHPVGIPRKPRPHFNYVLVACLVLRVSMFYQINSSVQCSAPGIEALFCLTIAIYEWLFNSAAEADVVEGPEDMWASAWDDFTAYLQGARLTNLLTMLAVTFGSYIAMSLTVHSTYFCSTVTDSASYIVFLQYSGVMLDLFMTILAWRILWWTNTAKGRLQIIGDTLFMAAVGCAFVLLPSKYSDAATPYLIVPKLVVHDGLLFAIWLVSFCHIICEVSLVTGPLLVIASVGAGASVHNMMKLGTWMQISAWASIGPLFLILFALFIQAASLDYTTLGIRSRFIIYLFLAVSMASCIAASFFGTSPYGVHPVKKLLYDRRVETDRWLMHAHESKSLRVAINEYKTRYNRDPPPGFDAWFTWAMDHNALIIDHYNQITEDLAPFWHLTPDQLRKRTMDLDGDPDVAILTIKNGGVALAIREDANVPELEELVSMVSEFAELLPDMSIAINTLDHPRILPIGSEKVSLLNTKTPAKTSPINATMSSENKPNEEAVKTPEAPHHQDKRVDGQGFRVPQEWMQIHAGMFRKMYAEACPVESPVYKDDVKYTPAEHCHSCELPFNQQWGQFPDRWTNVMATCEQPDLMHLHSFFSYPPTSHRVYPKLMPLFGKTKTGPFADILIPFDEKMPDDFDSSRNFEARHSSLFWRGYFTESSVHQPSDKSPLGNEATAHQQAFHGDLQNRIVHMTNNASRYDRVTLVLPTAHNKHRFVYKTMATQMLNKALPFDIGFQEAPPLCQDDQTDCSRATAEFQTQPGSFPLDNRFVFLPDNPMGPARETIRTVRSDSVPFVSTIFRQWWTERVHAWVHYVPIDPRLQALHGTLAYFTGVAIPPREHYQSDTNAGQEYTGRRVVMDDAMDDAKWIATQGKSWAKKALRREDKAVYMLRLLLEWARLVSDDRDQPGKAAKTT